jgi:hypothetical protein
MAGTFIVFWGDTILHCFVCQAESFPRFFQTVCMVAEKTSGSKAGQFQSFRI